MREAVLAYIKKKYKTSPEYPWAKYDDNAVFRHGDNKKWFALVMRVERARLGQTESGFSGSYADVINLKIDDRMFRDVLLREEGILPAYHMNKEHWLTVLLDGTVEEDRVFELIDISFAATASKKKKEKIRPAKEWIFPANPRFYDVAGAFEKEDVIEWKQSGGVKKGDTVFLYVAAPVSAILYRCKVTETDIPCDYQDKNLSISTLMKIKLLQKYAPDRFSFEKLKSEYGIYAVRGPRGVPYGLSHALKEQQ